MFDANPGDFYDSMGFFNRHHGLAFSDPVSGEFPILATHDSGGTWELVEPIAIPNALPNEFGRATGTSLVAVGPADAWFGTNPENDPGARCSTPRTGNNMEGRHDPNTGWAQRHRFVVVPRSQARPGGRRRPPPPPFIETGVGVAAGTSDGGTWSPRRPAGWVPEQRVLDSRRS